MPLRKVKDREETVRLLVEAEASVLARAVWARREGIDPRSLNLGRVNLACRDRRSPALRLVERVPRLPTSPGVRVRVRVRDLVVEVDATFDAATLGRVLAAC
jgi:hypothetical protein